MTEIKEEIHHFLKTYHTGKERAIHSKELENRFFLSGRSLRRVIGSLRRDGVAICSNENGYFYAGNQNEINDTIGRLTELAIKISNSRNGLMFASAVSSAVPVEITVKLGE